MDTITYTWQDIQEMQKYFRTRFVNSITGFRSALLIGTANKKGETNLALFSNVFHVGANPPLVGIQMRPVSVSRHTYENIRATGYFTINHVNREILKAAHHTSARFPDGISEFQAVGLTPEFSSRHTAPYVQESIIKIGLKYEEEYQVRANNVIVLIGQIIETKFPENLLREDGNLECELAGSIVACGLDTYFEQKQIMQLAYAKPDQPVKEV